MKRNEAREQTLALLFESDFLAGEEPKEIYERALLVRELKDDAFARGLYFGVAEKREEIDAVIAKYSMGWKTDRMSNVTRAVLRLGVYEIIYTDTPDAVCINEALELVKKYDDEKARSFANGILNAASKGKSAE